MKLTVRRLEPSDDRTRFRSGNIELDRFFLRYAGQNQFKYHIGTTYVAVRKDRSARFFEVTDGTSAVQGWSCIASPC